MADIVDLMKELNYPSNDGGVCYGIAYMAERARRCGQFDQFQSRRNYLHRLKEGELEPLIDKLSEKIKKFGSTKEGLELNDEEKILLSIPPFFWQVWAHFSPNSIQKFLDLKGPGLSQVHVHELESLIYDVNSDDKTLSPLNPPINYFIRAGNEENQGSLMLQEFFKTIVKYEDLSTGLLIRSVDHVIHVFYDKLKDQWTLTDPDAFHIDAYKDLQEMANSIVKRLKGSEGLANLVIKVFTDEPPQKTALLFKELESISNESLASLSQNTVNAVDSANNTALHVVAVEGIDDAAKKLLSIEGIDVNKENDRGYQALASAVASSHLQIVREILNTKKVDLRRSSKNNLLDLAVYVGNIKIVEDLLNYYIENKISISLFLAKAIDGGHVDVAKMLLNYREVSTIGALHCAVEKNNKEMVQILLNNPRISVNSQLMLNGNFAPLHLAAQSGNLEILRMLLQKDRVDVNTFGIYTTTPLIEAIKNKHIPIVQELLAHKSINVNYRGQLAGTALSNAITSHSKESVIELLKKENIEINDINPYCSDDSSGQSQRYNYTNLAIAIAENELDIVKVLRKDPRININKADRQDLTTLCLAIQKNNKAMVFELLKHKDIDVNKGNPLDVAIKNGDLEIVRALLNHPHINVNQVNMDGHSPLYLAIDSHHLEYDQKKECVFELLSNTYVDKIEIKDNDARFIMEYLDEEFPNFYIMQPFIEFIKSLEINLQKSLKITKPLKLEIDEIRSAIRKNLNNSELRDLNFIGALISKLLESNIKHETSLLDNSSQKLFSHNTGGTLRERLYMEFNKAKEESSDRLDQGYHRVYPILNFS